MTQLCEMNIDELRELIVNDFSKAWELNDNAHRIEHFEDVFKTAVVIRDTLREQVSKRYDWADRTLMLGAYFHDLFAWSRFNHHQLSSLYVESTDHLIFTGLNTHERKLISLACLEHRGSYKGVFSSPLSEIINAADRGMPGNIEKMMFRAVQCQLAKGAPPPEARTIAADHMVEKFGVDGYARYPEIYETAFGHVLKDQREQVMSLYGVGGSGRG